MSDVVTMDMVDRPRAHVDDVADSAPTACWGVEDNGWNEVAPALSDEVIALVARPVVVCFEPRRRPRAGA